ncbi:protein Bouncer isoform X2 [Notolabrus celidotus]|uniref:protein Bouncer isoform X2 n=1 Tax=Notolabrus celidotus TaxID=1203425 RepID=UPI00148FABB3|nr:protein Bouncer isoform X2 [Notolabrus celidotus]
MAQCKSSLDIHSLVPLWFLTSILLASALLLPALSLDSLLCYHCPLQQKGKLCPNITSQCLPHQRCSSSRGHYGPIHMLSAQGCMDSDLCGSHEIVPYRGVEYNVSHTCCCKDKCNIQLKSASSLKMLLGMIENRLDHNNGLRSEPWDSCANYTQPKSSPLVATVA